MTLNDPLANVLSFINHHEKLGKTSIVTKNNSKTIRKILSIMQKHGYISGFREIQDAKGNLLEIRLSGAINKTGVIKPQFQIKRSQIEKFENRYLPARDFGIIIMSTDQGIMTHEEAKKKGLGGKLLSYCY
jgi:small subunit ribosomal protein S8